MALNLNSLSLQQDSKNLHGFVFTALPVSALDLDRNAHLGVPANVDMHDAMADPCPACKGFCMSVGDYVCWGFCFRCYREAVEQADA